MKTLFFKLPEYYLMILVILAGYSPPFYVNPIFIGVIGVLILQIVIKNKILGFILGALFFLINLYFIGALFSEFNEFTEFTHSAKQLLCTGLTIWIANLVFSLTMMYKYITNNFMRNSQLYLKK